MTRRAFALAATAATLILAGCGGGVYGGGSATPYINFFSPTQLIWTTQDSADTARSLDFFLNRLPAGDATLRLYDGAGHELAFGADRVKPPPGNSADLEVAIKKSEIPAAWTSSTRVNVELKVAGQVIPQRLPTGLTIVRP